MKTFKGFNQEIQELSKKTLGSYVKKASKDATIKSMQGGSIEKPGSYKAADKKYDKAVKRLRGIQKATDRLTKEGAEEVNELSKKKLGSYIQRATDDNERRASDITRSMYKDEKGVSDPLKKLNQRRMKSYKRGKGIKTAIKKLTK